MRLRNVLFPLTIMMGGSLSGCAGGPDEAEARSMFLGLAYQYFFPDTAGKLERHANKSDGVGDVRFSKDYRLYEFGTADAMPGHSSPEDKFLHMTIYLEGDIAGWEQPYPRRDAVSSENYMMLDKSLADPTPSLYMVLTCDPGYNDQDQDCQGEQWKKKRFSKAAVNAVNKELDSLADRKGVVQFSLVGFGSGASLALAIAGKRQDIYSVTTLSGVLDPVARAKVSGEDLVDVDDPLINAKKLALIPQRHYVVDTKDDALSEWVDAYANKVGGTCTEVVKVPSSLFFSWSSVSYQKMNFPGPHCR
jgi:hypothetical protein